MKPIVIKPKTLCASADTMPTSSSRTGTPNPKQKQRVYHCGACLTSFSRYGKAKTHEQMCAPRIQRMNMCKYCLTLFRDEKLLEWHMERKHTDGKHLCLQCGKRYSTSTFLYRHVVTWHGEHSLFYCAMCADNCNDVKTFSDFAGLIAHAKRMHQLNLWGGGAGTADDEDYVGGGDGAFSDAEEMENLEMLEENIEDLLPIVDWDDDVTFGWPMDLDKESCIASAYVCPLCANNFTGSISLINHLEQVHKKSPLDCSYCAKTHPNREALRMHLQRMHVLIRKHICVECQLEYATADHLEKHMRSKHLPERHHKCDICGKRFAQLCHLKEHLKTDRNHHQGSSLICQLCNCRFYRMTDLQRHVNQKHG
ncbi:zinc finger protein 189 [Drosophila tropicalis]|uniref:zinc finger protein 189 n=1 Tax=Drosophila tropicalis TaxID=46794 RepID=UPI0035AB85FC